MAPVAALLVDEVLGVPEVDTDSTVPVELVTVVVTVPLALATTVVVVELLLPPPPPPPPLLAAPPVPLVDDVPEAAEVEDVAEGEDVPEVEDVEAADVDAVVGVIVAGVPLIALIFIDASMRTHGLRRLN